MFRAALPSAGRRAALAAAPAPARRVGAALPRAAPRRGAATSTTLYYQGERAPTSLSSTGKVGTYRDGRGSDGEFFGVDPSPTDVQVHDGRGAKLSLDRNGFKLVDHRWKHIDYYDNEAVLGMYYPEAEELVCQETGAKFAVAFDHNIRARSRKLAGEHLAGGGNLVQEPLISYGVHNDYSASSAVARVRQLAQPPRHNDTLRPKLGAKPAIDPEEVESLLEGRWVFVNVWRNIAPTPVQKFPLGLCDAESCSPEELVVFEIRYADRTGENYFSRYSPKHRWLYFPEATRDEAVILKCWDSHGKDFAHMMPGGRPASPPVPATFTLHSGFEDRASPQEAPDRESIEVRIVAFY